jgi:hypothetical protein
VDTEMRQLFCFSFLCNVYLYLKAAKQLFTTATDTAATTVTATATATAFFFLPIFLL